MIESYNSIKEFEGRKYTGMRVGGSHSWCYRQGEWNETKVAPDEWQFSYAVNKRRRWNAPEESVAPVGTEYHWYILAHQNVRKVNANEYSTSMTGMKYKLAHRRAADGEWSASEWAQLRRLITILEENIVSLRQGVGKGLRENGGVPAVITAPKSLKETSRRKILARNLPLGIVGQSPLEIYMAP